MQTEKQRIQYIYHDVMCICLVRFPWMDLDVWAWNSSLFGGQFDNLLSVTLEHLVFHFLVCACI